jgi:hypothetical protein
MDRRSRFWRDSLYYLSILSYYRAVVCIYRRWSLRWWPESFFFFFHLIWLLLLHKVYPLQDRSSSKQSNGRREKRRLRFDSPPTAISPEKKIKSYIRISNPGHTAPSWFPFFLIHKMLVGSDHHHHHKYSVVTRNGRWTCASCIHSLLLYIYSIEDREAGVSFLCVCAVVVVVPRAFFFLYTYRHPSLSSTCYYSRCVRGTTTTTRSCFSLVNTNRESFKLIALVPISKKKPILFFVFCFFFCISPWM